MISGTKVPGRQIAPGGIGLPSSASWCVLLIRVSKFKDHKTLFVAKVSRCSSECSKTGGELAILARATPFRVSYFLLT